MSFSIPQLETLLADINNPPTPDALSALVSTAAPLHRTTVRMKIAEFVKQAIESGLMQLPADVPPIDLDPKTNGPCWKTATAPDVLVYYAKTYATLNTGAAAAPISTPAPATPAAPPMQLAPAPDTKAKAAVSTPSASPPSTSTADAQSALDAYLKAAEQELEVHAAALDRLVRLEGLITTTVDLTLDSNSRVARLERMAASTAAATQALCGALNLQIDDFGFDMTDIEQAMTNLQAPPTPAGEVATEKLATQTGRVMPAPLLAIIEAGGFQPDVTPSEIIRKLLTDPGYTPKCLAILAEAGVGSDRHVGSNSSTVMTYVSLHYVGDIFKT